MVDRRPRHLTPQEEVFAEALAATGDKRFAAEKAGYRWPIQSANKIVKKPIVMAEVARIQTEKLYCDALPAAVDFLTKIIRNEEASVTARVQAAKAVINRTLGARATLDPKEPYEMTGEELARAIDELENEAAQRAKPVVDTPSADGGGVFE